MADVVLKQTNRSIVLDSPLGPDALIATYFEAEEHLSQLFRFRLELVSKQAIQPKDILGKGITVELQTLEGTAEKKRRVFHGIVVRFAPGPMWRNGYRNFHAELVPWTWFLTRTTDCRIFENKKAPDIIEKIFQDLGFSDFEKHMTEQHPTREYCVQFRETDFNFVSRLMEEEGMFYFFKHEKGKHTMVLADNKSAYLDCDERELSYTDHATVKTHISSWQSAYSYRAGKWTQRDYNFKTPQDKLETKKNTLLDTPKAQSYELYDYPGLYTKKGDGEELTKLRMEEEEASYHRVDGESDCWSFLPGYKFELTKHESKEENKNYVLTSVRHVATDHSHFTDEGPNREYRNSFSCIPDTVVYRPPRTTPKPVVHGIQTAIVTGPSGEDIHTDEYARIRVRFYWEREGMDSLWARVSQPWAGKQWGVQFIPRIGMEVVVDFLEGDPDRPVIVGSVYNADNMPPYKLTDNKTQSGWKTRSTTGGGDSNFNELRFEDKMGSEEVYFHAEKDFKRVVENNDSLKVGLDKMSPGKQDIEIWGDRTTNIDQGNDNLTLKMGSKTTTVALGSITYTAMQSITLQCGASIINMTPTSISLTSTAITLTAASAITQTAGGAFVATAGGAMSLTAAGAIAITAGGPCAITGLPPIIA